LLSNRHLAVAVRFPKAGTEHKVCSIASHFFFAQALAWPGLSLVGHWRRSIDFIHTDHGARDPRHELDGSKFTVGSPAVDGEFETWSGRL
jgi:hypothetical protein